MEKITFRGSAAALLGFLAALVLGPRLIGWLRGRFREPIVGESRRLCELHADKQSTPTMGGLFVVAGLVAGVAVFGDLGNRLVQVGLFLVIGLTVLGAIDDLAKLRGQRGISAPAKLLGQCLIATVAAWLIYQHHTHVSDGLLLHVPLVAEPLELGRLFIPLAVLVIVGASNAVNLTDGLDGLAGGCMICACGAMAVVAYAAGHAGLAVYLGVPRVPGAGETVVMAAAAIGAVMGFLWFNCHPAQVFLGDTGSLPLGGLLGFLAVATRQELLLLVIGGVFVVEAASVILQVGYFKWRKRRIFLCAPIHHHFQFLGWPESKIVVRFWIASALCAVLGIACLKLNVNEPATQSQYPQALVAGHAAPAESPTGFSNR
ncbi:MAG: phospho-N-acetylmuramoyl-pentapeptide-transferase [Planctomycetota bacterium]|nr:phospho-N-acetylmuramoyl-pentapeptide-transferase [Planctomycetota bacterium]